jgi:hypothetical protein
MLQQNPCAMQHPNDSIATSANAAPNPVHRRPFGRAHAASVRREIASLDAQRDCQRIVHLLVAYEFPFDLLRATEMALFHTFGSRSVARLLDRTGEFATRGQKRYDDTRLLIAQFIERGWDDEAGRRSLAQMNHIHARFRIPNDDYLFVLWTFVDFPLRWIADFGWREFTPHERAAWFGFWREIGRLMGLRDLPSTPAAFDEFARAYEAREFVHDAASQRVAEATVATLAAWLPGPLRFAVRPVVSCLVPARLLPAIGFAAPPAGLAPAVRGALKLRAWIKRFVSFERHPTLLADSRNRTYPGNRYRIESLGPEYAHREAGVGETKSRVGEGPSAGDAEDLPPGP